MSTQLDSYKDSDDQDPTDELPVLDIAAYEATFLEQGDDTAQLDITQLTKSVAAQVPPEPQPQSSLPMKVRGRELKGHAKLELTADVDLIPKRITDLEAQVVDLKGVNAELQQHLAETKLQLAVLQQNHNLLHEDLRASSGLAVSRAEFIASLQSHLSQAESSSVQLARQLAAQLMDNDALAKQLAARNLTIEELRDSVESLGARLSEALTSIQEFTEQLATRDQDLSHDRAQLIRRSSEIADRDGRITQLCKDIKHATDELHLVSAQRDDLLETLASYEQAQTVAYTVQTEQIQLIGELKVALQGSQAHAASLQTELHAALSELDKERKMHSRAAASLESSQHQLDKVRYELDAARTRDEMIEELRSKLQTKSYDETAIAERIAQAQQRVQSLVQLISHKNRKIASLKSDVTVYAAALAAIRGNLTRITGEDLEGPAMQRIMEPVEHDRSPITLDRKVTTIGRTIENDICLPSKLISRHHARLLAAPSGVIIEDTGSTNGCFVNGRQIRQQLMRDGDILSLGGLRYRLCAQPISDSRSRGNVIDINDVRSSLADAE